MTRERYWRLQGAPSYLLSRGKANGEMLEVHVGHCTDAALVRRLAVRVPLCFTVRTDRTWETGGALAVGSRRIASVPRPDAVS